MKTSLKLNRNNGRRISAGINNLLAAGVKRIAYGLLAPALLLAACDKENHDPDADPSLSISPATAAIHFGAAAEESYTYKVTTNRLKWMADCDQSWCKLLIDAGENTLTITADPNNTVTPPAPAKITITSADAAPLTITATQDGAEYDLYISGSYTDADTEKPCFWKNGTRIDLPGVDESGSGSTTAMTVSNGKVYIAGQSKVTGCYWIDGVCHELKEYYDTRSIAVDNESVYVLGPNMLWKDGVLDNSDFGNDFTPEAITVSDGTLYLAGQLHLEIPLTGYSADVAACGKLGSPNHLPTPIVSTKSNAFCATASAGSVYVGGYYYDEDAEMRRACFWKDRQKATPLETPVGKSEVWCICVENETVYSAGYYYNTDKNLCYWVNGKRMELQAIADVEEFFVTGIAAVEGTVWVSGAYWDKDYHAHACYWVNGELTMLPESEGVSEQYTSGIALVKK